MTKRIVEVLPDPWERILIRQMIRAGAFHEAVVSLWTAVLFPCSPRAGAIRVVMREMAAAGEIDLVKSTSNGLKIKESSLKAFQLRDVEAVVPTISTLSFRDRLELS